MFEIVAVIYKSKLIVSKLSQSSKTIGSIWSSFVFQTSYSFCLYNLFSRKRNLRLSFSRLASQAYNDKTVGIIAEVQTLR